MTGLRIALWLALGCAALFVTLELIGKPIPAVMVAVTMLVLSAAGLYYNLLRPANITLRREPGPISGAVDGYSAGRPFGNFCLVCPLLASNDGGRPGSISGWNVDKSTLQYIPRKPASFEVVFSALERPVRPGASATQTEPIPLPLLLPLNGRERVVFKAVLGGFGSPQELAEDLRDLESFRVSVSYMAGAEVKPKRRTMTLDFELQPLKHGLADYWGETDAWRPLANVIRGGR